MRKAARNTHIEAALAEATGASAVTDEPMQFMSDTGPYVAAFTKGALFELATLRSQATQQEVDANSIARDLVHYLELCEKKKVLNKEKRDLQVALNAAEICVRPHLTEYIGKGFPLLNGRLKLVHEKKQVRFDLKNAVRLLYQYVMQVEHAPPERAATFTNGAMHFILQQLDKESQLLIASKPPVTKLRRTWARETKAGKPRAERNAIKKIMDDLQKEAISAAPIAPQQPPPRDDAGMEI